MKIQYNITGTARKTLAGAVSQDLNAPTKYLGAPTFAYEVGGYRIDRNGVLEGEDNLNLLADLEGLHSFKAVSAEYDTPMTYEESPGGLGALEVFNDLDMTEDEELGLGKQRRDQQGEDGMRASDIPEFDESDTLTIEIPLEGFTEEAIANLEKLIASKANLIKKVIGVNTLPIERTENTLRFPWFRIGFATEEVNAYAHFIGSLCAMAKTLKRVNARANGAGVENEKYAFRCFLLRLGFIGTEYKTERKVLLSKLAGSAAFKNGNCGAEEAAE